jgi:RPA family protein
MADFVRKTAYKVALGDLAKGTFIKREGWDPSFIVGKDGLEISRVNVIAMAVGLEQAGNPSLIIDDGTGRMEVRAFGDENPFGDIEVGTLTLVVGRPRAYNGEIFISPEIVKAISDAKWAEVRKKELEGISIVDETPIEAAPPAQPETNAPEKTPTETVIDAVPIEEAVEDVKDANPSTKIYGLIKSLDSGDGADVDQVIKDSGVKDAEKIISNLLMEGDIFEVRNGRLKVLE